MRAIEIPVGEGRSIANEAGEIAVFRLRDGTFRALGAICPHRGGPLADGLLDDNVVICPLHGRTYDLMTGAETAYGGDAVQAFSVTVVDGEIVVT